MLAPRFIKRLLLVVFVIRTAAQQRPTAPQQPPPQLTQRQAPPQRIDDDDFQPIHRLPPIPMLQFDPVYLQQSAIANDVEAGNGNALAVLGQAADTPPMVYTEGGQNPNPGNWFTVWLKEEQQRQLQRQRERANFPNQNVALPFTRNYNRNTKFKFQTNGIDDNSYPGGDGSGYDDSGNYGVIYTAAALLNEQEQRKKQQEDSAADDSEAAEQMKISFAKLNDEDVDNYTGMMQERRALKRSSKSLVDQLGWREFTDSNYEWLSGFKPPSDYSNHGTVKRVNWRSYKREKPLPERNAFVPSISAGVMTNLGDFFRELSKNMRFTQKYQLEPAELKLLEGNHPLRMLHEEWVNSGGGGGGVDNPTTDASARKTADFLHAIVNYRPSQKIRSLVAMNPSGYHGSHFIDPNYMWVGLGK